LLTPGRRYIEKTLRFGKRPWPFQYLTFYDKISDFIRLWRGLVSMRFPIGLYSPQKTECSLLNAAISLWYPASFNNKQHISYNLISSPNIHICFSSHL
jgi:hypothetical protein